MIKFLRNLAMRHKTGGQRSGFTMAIFAVCFSLLAASNAQAVKLYKWVDAEGKITYQDQPPPHTDDYEEKDISTQGTDLKKDLGFAMSSAAEASPVILYAVTKCESCDLMRLFLEHHKIPFTEKNVQGDQKVQEELIAFAGALRVPLLKIGDKSIDGYSRSAIADLLRSFEYPIDFP